MKKLKLKFDDKETLSKEQMKKVTGGTQTGWLCTCDSNGAYSVFIGDFPAQAIVQAVIWCEGSPVDCDQLW